MIQYEDSRNIYTGILPVLNPDRLLAEKSPVSVLWNQRREMLLDKTQLILPDDWVGWQSKQIHRIVMLKVTVEVHNAMDDASKRPIFKQASLQAYTKTSI